jgi:hypothetical protein
MAALDLSVPKLLISRWAIEQVNASVDSLSKKFKIKKKAAHAGPLCQLEAVEDALLHYIFELHVKGITVNRFMVGLKASLLLSDFCKKNFTDHCSIVKHFFVAHLFSHQMGTHIHQHPQPAVKSNALDYMQLICCIIASSNCNLHFNLNMDQLWFIFWLMPSACWS